MFEKLAQGMNEPRLLLDSALLWLKNGNYEKAYQIATEGLSDAQYEDFFALLSYDVGDYETAYELLSSSQDFQESPEILHLVADSLTKLDKPKDAIRYYLQYIRYYPKESWVPYVNVSQFLMREGEIPVALSYLNNARVFFPDNWDVRFETARILAIGSQTDGAQAVLKDLRGEKPDDVRAILVQLQMDKSYLSLDEYAANLWKLFNHYPGEIEVCKMLVVCLLNLGDVTGADAAIHQITKHQGDNAWTFQVKGIISALRRDYLKAIEYFENSLTLETHWIGLYNRAVLSYAIQNATKALEYFTLAQDQIVRTSSTEKESISRIGTMIGKSLLQRGEREQAKQQILDSLEVDPGNYRSLLLLKQLEAEEKP